ncbi:hypothetical protein HC928_02625 [bacterium]|nr:hypothetical protein [bacterium]
MKHKIRLLGISGQLSSGKDTVADYMVAKHKFVRVALADPIKWFGYTVFLFTQDQLWGPSDRRNGIDKRYTSVDSEAWESALARIQMFGRTFCQKVMGTDEVEDAYQQLIHWFYWLRDNYHAQFSPRIMLQALGTEWGRENVDPDIWLNYALRISRTLLHADGSTQDWEYDPLQGIVHASGPSKIRGVVISDVRFENEFAAIRNTGGAVIRVVRPDTDANALNIGITNHASEAHEFSYDSFDFVLNNDKTLEELYENVDLYMNIFDISYH